MLRFVLLLTICFLAVVATATDGTGPVDEPSELTSAVQNRNVSVINSLYSLPNNIKLFVGQNKALRTGLSGAAAGSVQVATLMWLRTITSYQSSYDVSFFEAVETLYAEGGLERFYRGISFALVQGPLSRFGSIAANSLAESALMTNNSDAYLIWLNATLRKGLPADSIGDSGTFSNDYGANLGLLPASVSASISKALTATTDQYRSVYLAAVEQCVRLNAGLLRQLSPAAVGSVLSGMWRVLLMPLDTLKTIQQVEGASGYQRLLEQLMSTGSVSMLYEGTLTTLLAASVGHYPWFYVYNYLDGTLGAESGSQLALTDMFASVRQQWNNTQLTTLGSVTSIAAAMTSFFGGLWHDLTHAYTAIGQWAFSHWIWDNKLIRSAFIGFMASTASDISSNVFRVLKTIKQTSGVRGGIGGAGIGGGSAAIGGMLSQISIASFPSTAATSMVATNSVSYIDIISTIIQENGVWSLFTRGLSSRVISNGLQSILFTVVWKEIMSRYAPSTPNPTSSTNTNVNTNTNTNTNTAAINTDPSIDATHSGLTH